MEFKKFIISETQLIEQAIELIEMNQSRCVIIVNNNCRVVGILSEGDILRSILKGINILSPVKNIMITNFKYLLVKDETKIMDLFKSGITLIPILNENHELKDIVVLTKYFENKSFI
jgi:CBS domain-containing protein